MSRSSRGRDDLPRKRLLFLIASTILLALSLVPLNACSGPGIEGEVSEARDQTPAPGESPFPDPPPAPVPSDSVMQEGEDFPPQPPPGEPAYARAVLNDGDPIEGELLAGALRLMTRDGLQSFEHSDVARISFGGGPGRYDYLTLRDGEKLEGTFEDASVRIRTPGGTVVDILRSRLKELILVAVESEPGELMSGVLEGEGLIPEEELFPAVGLPPNAVPAQSPMRVGGEIEEPELLNHVAPEYPELARAARVQGIVILQATIDRQGNVKGVEVLRGMPLGLDEAAVAAVSQWRYAPTRYRGQLVEVVLTVTVNFQLQQEDADE